MAVTGWFLGPYTHLGVVNTVRPGVPGRMAAITEYDALIRGDNGNYVYTECLGDCWVAGVRCDTAQTLTTLAADARFDRLPKALLDSTLADLTAAQKTALRNRVLALGYTPAEVNARFGADIGAFTLRQVVAFVLTRRLRPRLDVDGQTIILDGQAEVCETPETIEARL